MVVVGPQEMAVVPARLSGVLRKANISEEIAKLLDVELEFGGVEMRGGIGEHMVENDGMVDCKVHDNEDSKYEGKSADGRAGMGPILDPLQHNAEGKVEQRDLVDFVDGVEDDAPGVYCQTVPPVVALSHQQHQPAQHYHAGEHVVVDESVGSVACAR